MIKNLILYYSDKKYDKYEDADIIFSEEDNIILSELKNYQLDRFKMDSELEDADAELIEIPKSVSITAESDNIRQLVQNRSNILIITDIKFKNIEYVIKDMVTNTSVYILFSNKYFINIFNLILESKQENKITSINIIKYDYNI